MSPTNGARRIVHLVRSFTGIGRGLSLWLYEYQYAERQGYIAKPVEFEPHEESAVLGAPTMSLDEDMAQALMDELWSAGVRPRDIGTAGHLAATQAHLNDMRAIASKKLGVELGQSGGRAQPPRGGMFG